MPKTGNIFLDFISFVSAFFPLITLAVILIKKKYHNDALNFLMIICLLDFIGNFLLFIPTLAVSIENIISNFFSLIEFIFLMLIFKNFLSGNSRNMLNILFSILLSVVITTYFAKGVEEKIFFVQALLNGIIIFASVFSIAKITSADNLDIFDKPLFWIAIGSLFYFTMLILLQSLGSYSEKNLNENEPESTLLINVGNIVRYFFYLLAAFFYEHPKGEDENLI
jgi:hypothetical protein